MMPRMRQALVEFENVEDALTCVQSCQVELPFWLIMLFIVDSCLCHVPSRATRCTSWIVLYFSISLPVKKSLGEEFGTCFNFVGYSIVL